jgi:SSS family solute:Na+ symporter
MRKAMGMPQDPLSTVWAECRNDLEVCRRGIAGEAGCQPARNAAGRRPTLFAAKANRLFAGLFAAAIIAVAMPAWSAEKPASEPVDAALRERAVSTLRRVLDQEQKFVKVHAAEFLLALDYAEGVQQVFLKELELHGTEPQYRIGIWRVLARAAARDDEHAQWVGKICDVFVDPAASDRLHAVETLAKLNYVVDKKDSEQLAAMEQAARPEAAPLTPYAAWVLLNSSQPDTETAESRLAELLTSDDVDTRMGAAYAFRHQGAVSAATLQKLLAAVKREPADSNARVFMVAAAAIHAHNADRASLKAELLQRVAAGKEEDRVEAGRALAEIADDSDLAALVPLIDDSSADVAATAADAVLRIGRRVPRCLSIWDWAVIVAYALGMLCVGWYYSRRTKTQEQYLLGDRQMRPLIVGVSLFASLFSCISYLAWPGEIIKYGPMILGSVLAYPFVAFVVGWLIIPFIMRLKVTSAYEILELRLGASVRTLGSVLFLLLRLLWMSVIVYAMATKVLVPLAGLPAWSTPLVCGVLALVTIVYTAMGGLRAVVITDVIQAVILFAAAIATVAVVSVCLGGVQGWWPTHWAAHWPEPRFGYDPGSRVPLAVVILSVFTWYVCTSTSDQIAIQRYLSTKDAKAARSVLIISLVADVFVTLMLVAVGLALLAYFRAFPQMLHDKQTILADSDKLFPQFIIAGLPVGVSGLVVAGLLACAMSAFSAGINSTCSVFTVDILDRIRGKKAGGETGRVGQLKHVSVLIGVIVVCLSFFVNMVEGNLLAVCYKVVNLLTAPLAGLFLLSMFVPWARTFGALVGAACGLATVIVISYCPELTGGLTFLWAMPLGLAVEFCVGALASLIPIGQVKPMLTEQK